MKHEYADLGERADELADVYQLMAKCKSEVVKNHNFVTMDQLEEDKEVVEMCRKSAEYRKLLSGDEHEVCGIVVCDILMRLTPNNSNNSD